MNLGTIILIITAIILLIVLYKLIKPYILRYDTTILFTGGLGAGKTYSAVKQAIICLRKNRFRIKCYNKIKRKLFNFFYKKHNKKTNKFIVKYNNLLKNKDKNKKWLLRNIKKYKKAKYKELLPLLDEPKLYSNIPIHYKKSLFSRKREWSKKLKPTHITMHEEIEQLSIVLIDELPQLVNQFNWNEELVKKNINEFITFFRHYIGGYLIITGQSENDIVAQIRRKLNIAIWCFNIKFYPLNILPVIYSIRHCDMLMSDNVDNINTNYIDENTKKKWGFCLGKGTYASRCYKNRYKNIYKGFSSTTWDNLYTNEIIKIKKEISPLDDGTSETFKKAEYEKVLEMQNTRKDKNDGATSTRTN